MMAILHTLLNINDSTILGSRLSGYKDFFAGVSSDIRGESIASQADLLEINNSYDMFHPVQNIAADVKKEVFFIFHSHVGKSLFCFYSFHECVI